MKCKNAKDADAANVIMQVLLLTVSPGGVETTAKLRVKGGVGGWVTEKFYASGDSIPPKPC